MRYIYSICFHFVSCQIDILLYSEKNASANAGHLNLSRSRSVQCMVSILAVKMPTHMHYLSVRRMKQAMCNIFQGRKTILMDRFVSVNYRTCQGGGAEEVSLRIIKQISSLKRSFNFEKFRTNNNNTCLLSNR